MKDLARLNDITRQYDQLTIAIVGDFCLDRYLEIDPALAEISLETGLPVHNVVRVRSQPGAAGTVLNNLAALGVGRLIPIGWCGDDGEGYELRRALSQVPGVTLDAFVTEPSRRTFTYCKPLLMHPGAPPEELNRLDSKNRLPTPSPLQEQLCQSLRKIVEKLDAIVVMDQTPTAETGTVTQQVKSCVMELAERFPKLTVIADSRRGLADWRTVGCKMNAAELSELMGLDDSVGRDRVAALATELAARNQRPVFITMAEQGLIGATPEGQHHHVPAFPVSGPIDVVGAGDSVTANLACALAVGASISEALRLAAAASSIVIHQLGTTGTANRTQIAELLNRSD